jgi:hypothetical protein
MSEQARRVDGFHERVLSQPAAYHEGPAVYAIIEDMDECEGKTPLVKLGKAAGHPSVRLRELQTGNPLRLALLAYTHHLTERSVHLRWRHLRQSGEWFVLSAELIQELLTWDWLNVGLMKAIAPVQQHC